MKVLNRICQVLTVLFGVTALVLFFTRFATIVSAGNNVNVVGAQLAFGSKIKALGKTVDMARSADLLFCFWVTVISLVSSVFSFKFKGLRYAAPGFGLLGAIYMLVIALSNPWNFVDTRPLTDVTKVTYGPFVLFVAIALFAFVVAGIAYLLIDDYIEVKASNGKKLTIPKRIVRFFRDYKSEVKKIVWPSFKDVVKNTVIVIVMCALAGILIWAVDYGLGKLLALILGA